MRAKRICKRSKNIEQASRVAKKRAKHLNDANKALPKPCSPRTLPKCTWQFRHKPDQDNFGPQLVLTEPNGNSHYLVDPETFVREFRYYSAKFEEEENKLLVTEGGFEALLADEDSYNDGDDEKPVPAAAAQATMAASARWKTRLQEGIMQQWKKRSLSAILPLYHTNRRSNPSSSSDVLEGMERTSLLGFSGSWSSRHCRIAPEEASPMLKRFGALGIMRSIAYCCPQ